MPSCNDVNLMGAACGYDTCSGAGKITAEMKCGFGKGVFFGFNQLLAVQFLTLRVLGPSP